MEFPFSFSGKYLLRADLLCKTGLHIGGSTTGLEIGGVDNPVIKDPITGEPYIPGSSLKGKLRSLTEWSLGLIGKHSSHQDSYAAYECKDLEDPRPSDPKKAERWDRAQSLGRLYGASSSSDKVRFECGPSRLTVRDSFLSNKTKESLAQSLGPGLFTEVKTENALDRITSEANPRPLERVPAGSRFETNLIVDIYGPQDHDLLKLLFSAMLLLEHSALGGAGSRGSGQVVFQNLQLTCRPLAYYQTGVGEVQIALPGKTLEEIVREFDKIQWKI